MRLLIVDGSMKEREATIRLLPPDTHEIRIAEDAAEALRMLEVAEVDVVLVEMNLARTSGPELVKRIRARESGTHVYIVMTASRPMPGDVKTAFAVGADDFIRKPMARDELVARIEGPIRIRRWAAKVLGGSASADFEAKAAITSLTAWTSAESTLCSELVDTLGFALTPVPSSDPLDGATEMAMLPLSLASEQAEVSIAIGIDQASAAALAETMFGSAEIDPTAVKDMLRELANVAGGAFKRMAATEGRVLTTGLPSETSPRAFRHANAAARKHWIGTVEGSPIEIRFEVELRTRELKRLKVASLREGMVIAADLRNQLGALLIPSGTRITESHLGGLRRALGAEVCVDVLEAA